MGKTHLFPLSADPIHFGHIDLFNRIIKQPDCDRLIVAVMNNGSKRGRYLFTLEERWEMAKRAVALFCRSSKIYVVCEGERPLQDVFLRHGCDDVLRGVRDQDDRDYESEQRALHRAVNPVVGHHNWGFLPAREEFRLVSSSLVKAMVQAGMRPVLQMGSLKVPMVPAFVARKLQFKIHNQIMIGITGTIASGKTWVGKELGKDGHFVNLDQLQRDLWDEYSPGAQKLRDRLGELVGEDVLYDDRRKVNREKMKERFFTNALPAETKAEVSRMVAPHIERLFRDAIRGKKGFIFFEWAQLAEMDMGDWVNHTTIVVDAPREDKILNVAERGIPEDQLNTILQAQWSADQKEEALFGPLTSIVLRYENSRSGGNLPMLWDQIKTVLGHEFA